MCGIAGIFNIQSQTPELRNKALRMAQKIRHRGPDWSGIYVGGSAILAHERLSIVDPESGGQPLYSPDRKQVLAVNGEIYNHRDIRARYAGKYAFQTGSDCEVILALYKDKGIRFLEELNGIFAFALYDEETDDYLIARDPIGVIPLYIGRDKDGHIYFGSELKALEGFCDEYEPFLPGHYYRGREGKMHRWYTRDWMDYAAVKDNYTPAAERNAAPASIGRTAYSTQVTAVHDALEAAVQRQLMSDVPYGVLLSGGLDSSVISAIAKKYAAKRIETDNKADAWWPQLHSFAVGLKGAPDLIKAREVARHIGTVHHEINYTVQEGLDAIRDVIYFIETYDITTVRASTPCICWRVSSKAWASRWYSAAKVQTRCSAVTFTSTRRPHRKPFTKKPCASSPNYICTTASVPTKALQPGEWKDVSPSSTKNSWMLPCASIRQSRCAPARK